MKRYIKNIVVIGIFIIAFGIVGFIVTIPWLMTDEPVKPQGQLIGGIYFGITGFPLNIINSDWPWNVREKGLGISLLVLNFILQTHFVYVVFRLIKYFITRNRRAKKTV